MLSCIHLHFRAYNSNRPWSGQAAMSQPPSVLQFSCTSCLIYVQLHSYLYTFSQLTRLFSYVNCCLATSWHHWSHDYPASHVWLPSLFGTTCHEHLFFSHIPPFPLRDYSCVDHMIDITSSPFYSPYLSDGSILIMPITFRSYLAIISDHLSYCPMLLSFTSST